MSDNASTTPVAKRDELRAKIEASERRIAERTVADQAKEAAGAATTYVKENPLTVLGGAIAVGIVIGALTKPGRRAATRAATGAASAVGGAASSAATGVGNAAKSQGSKFGTLLADAMVAYGIKLIDDALETSRGGRDVIDDAGESASTTKRTVRQKTRRRAESAVRSIKDRVIN